MNLIELVTGLPDWKWKENSQREILMSGEQLLNMSDFVWRIGAVALVGFMYTSYTSPPWMWFLLADDIKFADLFDFRRLTLRIPKGTLTAVAADFPVGLRFAKLYGFKETDQEQDHFGRVYKLMRKM